MKSSIASDTVKLTTSKIITMLISLIATMLLSRFRTLEEYGTYSQLLLVINIIIPVLMFGLPNSVNFFLSRSETENEKREFLSVYYTLSTILSVFMGVVLVILTPFIVNQFKNPLIINFGYVLAILPWAKIIQESINNVLVVYHETTKLLIYKALNGILLLLIIFITQMFGLGFSKYMLLFIIIQTIFALYVYIIVKRISGGINVRIDLNVAKQIFIFAIPIGLANIVATINTQLDKLIIGKIFNTEQLAIYTNAAREMPVMVISSSLIAILMPQLVLLLKDDKKDVAIDLWGDASNLSYIFICFFAIGLFVFAPDVITLLYSEKYLPGVSVFRVYCLVLLLRFTYFGMILNCIGKTKYILYSSIISIILNIILNIFFSKLFGFIGPSIATLISLIVVATVLLSYTSKNLIIPFHKLLKYKELFYITLINIAMGTIFYYIKIYIPVELFMYEELESVFLGCIWGGAYIIIMRKMIIKYWNILN